jgi:hypothetical protein
MVLHKLQASWFFKGELSVINFGVDL